MHFDLSLPILIFVIVFPGTTDSCNKYYFLCAFQNGVIFKVEGLLVIHDKLHL